MLIITCHSRSNRKILKMTSKIWMLIVVKRQCTFVECGFKCYSMIFQPHGDLMHPSLLEMNDFLRKSTGTSPSRISHSPDARRHNWPLSEVFTGITSPFELYFVLKWRSWDYKFLKIYQKCRASLHLVREFSVKINFKIKFNF